MFDYGFIRFGYTSLIPNVEQIDTQDTVRGDTLSIRHNCIIIHHRLLPYKIFYHPLHEVLQHSLQELSPIAQESSNEANEPYKSLTYISDAHTQTTNSKHWLTHEILGGSQMSIPTEPEGSSTNSTHTAQSLRHS